MSNFIVTADWHLREKLPRCRVDEDWLSFQESIIKFIIDKANKMSCDVCIVGDIFDSSNIPSNVLSMFIKECSKIKNTVYLLAGNHDLQYHSMENIDRSSIGVLKNISSEHNRIKYGMDFYGKWADFNDEIKGKESGLLFIHRLVFNNSKSIPPNVQAGTAQDMLDEFPKAKYIFLGDNHGSFIYEKKGRFVINPGSIYRGEVGQKDYKPSVYYVDTDEGIIEQIFLPDTGPMVEDAYILAENEKEERISAFVEKLKKNEVVELDFMKNIEKALLINKKLDKEIVKVIRELCEEEN
jgi:DNA repair exonuclease SbcCD nuclease subunit